MKKLFLVLSLAALALSVSATAIEPPDPPGVPTASEAVFPLVTDGSKAPILETVAPTCVRCHDVSLTHPPATISARAYFYLDRTAAPSTITSTIKKRHARYRFRAPTGIASLIDRPPSRSRSVRWRYRRLC